MRFFFFPDPFKSNYSKGRDFSKIETWQLMSENYCLKKVTAIAARLRLSVNIFKKIYFVRIGNDFDVLRAQNCNATSLYFVFPQNRLPTHQHESRVLYHFLNRKLQFHPRSMPGIAWQTDHEKPSTVQNEQFFDCGFFHFLP